MDFREGGRVRVFVFQFQFDQGHQGIRVNFVHRSCSKILKLLPFKGHPVRTSVIIVLF